MYHPATLMTYRGTDLLTQILFIRQDEADISQQICLYLLTLLI